jgi:mannose-1-phosphate guanylyltransferase
MQALVLVGGEGTRMRPLTSVMPKPVLPLVDRPFAAYMIDWLGRHGVSEIVMACGFMADEVRGVLGDGPAGGPRIRYVSEPEPRGTAGGIRYAERLLEHRFLALNGDILADLDLTALIAEHERREATATIALHPVEDPAGYGLVRRKDDGEIVEFVEKPGDDRNDTHEINAGAYVLERSLLAEVPEGREVSIEREVFPRLVGRGLVGVRLEGYWMDIGTPERYLQATWDILEGNVDTVVGRRLGTSFRSIAHDVEAAGSARIVPPALIQAGTRIAADARVGSLAVVGRGCEIGEGSVVESAVLHDRCRIGAGAVVSDAILAAGVEIGEGTRIDRGAVIGERARVGARNRLSNGARVSPGVRLPDDALGFAARREDK